MSDAEIDEIISQAQTDLGIRLNIISEHTEGSPVAETSSQEEVETPVNEEPTPEVIEETPVEETVEELEENSPSIFTRETTSRFSGADWFNIVSQQNIILAGVGGIGSWTSLLLARMRPNSMFIYDPDFVELANMSGQLFRTSSVGNTKVSVCGEIAAEFADYRDIFCIAEPFTEETGASDIMICGFDSMKARKTFFDSWIQHLENKSAKEKAECLFIDGRMSAESLQVFAFTGDDDYSINKYKSEWLFEDSEADSVVCSYKQTTYCAALIGGIITNIFVNFCTNLGNPNIPREIPFMTSYEADRMYFKLEI